MNALNITTARKKLYHIIEDVNASHQPIHIIGKKGSAVLISENDWNALEETLYLLQVPGMSDSIKKGLKTPLKQTSKKLLW